MRAILFPASSGRCPTAVLALWLACMAAAHADPIAANAVYGFAEQKVYGMTLTATPGSSASLVGAAFSVKMSTHAAFDTSPSGVAHNGGLDALQSFVTGGVPSQPVENFIGNASVGMSLPAGERVLRQLNTTASGSSGGFDATNPRATDFFAGHNFARSDGYVTPNPDASPVLPPASGAPPGGLPADGNLVPAALLYAPVGTPGTLSIDLVAEALLNGEGIAKLASGVSDWVVTGGFMVSGAADTRAAVSLDFNLVERLVIYSWNPELDIAAVSNTLALDIVDATGRSVFGPFLGTNPSITRMLSTAAGGSMTYNNHTLIPTHVYPGPAAVNFQTMPLAPGRYAFTLKGTTTAYVTSVPEPASHVLATIAAACGAALSWRRRRDRRQWAAPSLREGFTRRG